MLEALRKKFPLPNLVETLKSMQFLKLYWQAFSRDGGPSQNNIVFVLLFTYPHLIHISETTVQNGPVQCGESSAKDTWESKQYFQLYSQTYRKPMCICTVAVQMLCVTMVFPPQHTSCFFLQVISKSTAVVHSQGDEESPPSQSQL